MLKDQTRIVVPTMMRKKLLEREHLANSGITKIQDSVKSKYYWPGIKRDVKETVQTCEAC